MNMATTLFAECLEQKVKFLQEKEEEYEKVKRKLNITVENGLIYKNDRKENEILILRAENSNLKKTLEKKEEEIKELKIREENLTKEVQKFLVTKKTSSMSSNSNINININDLSHSNWIIKTNTNVTHKPEDGNTSPDSKGIQKISTSNSKRNVFLSPSCKSKSQGTNNIKKVNKKKYTLSYIKDVGLRNIAIPKGMNTIKSFLISQNSNIITTSTNHKAQSARIKNRKASNHIKSFSSSLSSKSIK